MGHIIALLLIATGLTAVQPAKAIPDADTRHDVISFAKDGWAPVPYELSHGVILLKATINGQPITMLLDNGTSDTMIDEGYARRNGIPIGKPTKSAVTGVSTTLSTRRTDSVQLGVPHALTITGPLIAMDLTTMSKALGQQIAAVLGADVLDHIAFMVRPDQQKVVLIGSGGITVGPGALTVPLLDGHQIDATVNGIPVKLEVDFGSNGVVSLNDPAWRRAIPAGAAIETGSHISADGVNRVEQRTKGELRVGSASVRDAPIDNGYTRTDKGDGLLGNGFLSKAGVIVDVQEKKLILIPQRANNAPPPRASGSTGA